ncbi:hypothetical protein ABBQ38_002129 [Trebouxia sp. C0009 RCD-2024]
MISGCPPVTLSSVGIHCSHRVHAQLVRPHGHGVCGRHLRLRHSSKTVSPVAAVNKDEGQLTVQSPVAALKRLQSRLRGGENGAAEHAPAEEAAAPDYKVVVALCAAVSLICSIDRASISVAIVPMAEQYGWSDSVKGAISSSFFLGYTITNLIGGYVATKYSSKVVLGGGVVLWSLFTVFTPTAADLGLMLVPLLLSRGIMGAGEGVAFPAISNLFSNWVPVSAKSRSLGLAYSAGQIGNIVALITSPLLITNYGWKSAFWLYGTLGLTWMLAWVPLVPDQPPNKTKAARQLGGSGNIEVSSKSEQGVNSLGDVPWRRFLNSKALWGLVAVHCSFGVGPLVCLSWLPSYYSDEWGLDVAKSSFLSGLPWAISFALANLAGFTADNLINKKVLSITATRKLMQGIASLGPATCLTFLTMQKSGPDGGNLMLSAALLTGTLGLGGFQAAGYGSNHQDLSPKYSGILFGLTNASASSAGALAVFATGVLLDKTDSWSVIFGAVAVVYALGFAGFALLGSGELQYYDD